MAKSVRRLLHQREILSSIPSAQVQKLGAAVSSTRWRQEDLLGLAGSQSVQAGELWVQGETLSLKINKEGSD